MPADKTVPKQLEPHIWQPGQSGNPNGRPKSARSKLQEGFLKAFAQDFEENGEAVIRNVRNERPADYLKIAASLLPKQVEGSDDPEAQPIRHEFAWKSGG